MVAAAAATFGVDHAKASESGQRDRDIEAKLQQPASRERSNYVASTQDERGTK